MLPKKRPSIEANTKQICFFICVALFTALVISGGYITDTLI